MTGLWCSRQARLMSGLFHRFCRTIIRRFRRARLSLTDSNRTVLTRHTKNTRMKLSRLSMPMKRKFLKWEQKSTKQTRTQKMLKKKRMRRLRKFVKSTPRKILLSTQKLPNSINLFPLCSSRRINGILSMRLWQTKRGVILHSGQAAQRNTSFLF